MENEIKVGDWIRDKNGLIIKVNEIQDYSEDDDIWYEEEILKGTWKSMVVKHSPNLIDLICEGDYVNGEKVVDIFEIYDENEKPISKRLLTEYRKAQYNGTYRQYYIYEQDIENIVTKEMMESITYKVTKM